MINSLKDLCLKPDPDRIGLRLVIMLNWQQTIAYVGTFKPPLLCNVHSKNLYYSIAGPSQTAQWPLQCFMQLRCSEGHENESVSCSAIVVLE